MKFTDLHSSNVWFHRKNAKCSKQNIAQNRIIIAGPQTVDIFGGRKMSKTCGIILGGK